MKSQHDILKEEIEKSLFIWENKSNDERSLDVKLKEEILVGNNILRWARQGFLKIDEEALKKCFS